MPFVSPTPMTHLMRTRRIDEEAEEVKLRHKKFNVRKRHKRGVEIGILHLKLIKTIKREQILLILKQCF